MLTTKQRFEYIEGIFGVEGKMIETAPTGYTTEAIWDLESFRVEIVLDEHKSEITVHIILHSLPEIRMISEHMTWDEVNLICGYWFNMLIRTRHKTV